MKRTRFLTTLIAATAFAGLTFTSCEKSPDQNAKDNNGKPAEPAKPGEPAKPAAKATEAPKAPVVAAADVAKVAGQYGFASKIANDVEGFSLSYRLHDLWTGLANSKFAATLLELPPLKNEPGFQRMVTQWNSPEGQQVREVLAEVFGNEWGMVMPAGFTAQIQPWMDVLALYQSTLIQGSFMSGIGGSPMSPEKLQQLMKDAAPEFIPALAKCEAPSLMFVAKAGKIRELVDQGTSQLVAMVGVELPPAFETEKFKVGEYEFHSISVAANKLIAQFQEVQLELQLKEILGDEAAAKKALQAISNKRFELSWGWVGEYLVIATGKDHAHVKFAVSEAESVLALPSVGARAAAFAAKKPMSLAYVSKAAFEKLDTDVEFADSFKSVAGELAGILQEEQITAMVADVKKLEGKAKALFTTSYTDQVSVGWWEGGFRSEMFGGAKDNMLDHSKPLAFANLATPGTFLLLNGRTNAAYSKGMTEFIEEGAGTLWGWYEKYGRTMVPEGERQGAAMIEATAIPILKDLWKASRKLGDALGDETAFVFDTVGKVPQLPDVPPFVAEGLMPRLAYVVEMKDRAGVSTAWTSFSGIVKQVVALVGGDGGGPTIPEPQMKKEGDAEIHFVPLPLETGDLLPHIAIGKDRWIMSTSPSLSAEIASKPASTTGPAAGMNISMNFGALFDHVDAWLKVVDKNADAIMGPNAEQFQSAKPLIDTAMKLVRSLQGIEATVFEEGGVPRASGHIKIQDAK